MSVNTITPALRALRKPIMTKLARDMEKAEQLRAFNPLKGYSEAILNEITTRGFRFRDELVGRKRSAITNNRKALREDRRKASPALNQPGMEDLRQLIDAQLNHWHIHQVETHPIPSLAPRSHEQPLDWGQQEALEAYCKGGYVGFVAATLPVETETAQAA